ncbi:MAG TPA: bifunctional riboflavin kinase/FAD synthetase [Thermoanaerobaculia bacterium]|nr:bifunctional riboflavin kinase/FAD synthetase [Thermoanaerobaculia bacterium]
MQVIYDALHADDVPSGTVVTVGNYDGIHLGQQSVLELVVARARATGLLATVVTFDPHPLAVLQPESAPPRITTATQRERLLDGLGVDLVLVIRFTPEFARTPARSFVRDFLHGRLRAEEIYVGANFSFGHRREGDVSLLQQMGEPYGFRTFAVDEVRIEGERASSTRIRRLLREGQVADAARLLGRPYALTGLVARGDRMGQRLGWPTINVIPDNELVPLDGVYASRVYFPSFSSTFDSATNIGTRPTVYENFERVVESHILDFAADVYGESVELLFYRRLREERIFQSMMDLSAQIRRDVDATRELFRAVRQQEEAELAASAADGAAPAQ